MCTYFPHTCPWLLCKRSLLPVARSIPIWKHVLNSFMQVFYGPHTGFSSADTPYPPKRAVGDWGCSIQMSLQLTLGPNCRLHGDPQSYLDKGRPDWSSAPPAERLAGSCAPSWCWGSDPWPCSAHPDSQSYENTGSSIQRFMLCRAHQLTKPTQVTFGTVLKFEFLPKSNIKKRSTRCWWFF